MVEPKCSTPANILAIVAILVVDALVVCLIGGDGDFPLSDDWAYAWPVRSLCERGDVDLLPWSGASSMVQIWYGATLCRMFGFSFEVLRASNLVMGAIADAGVFVLARTLGVSVGLALFAALTFALSPLRVNLGFTFMTDLPFTAFAVWSACAFVSAMRRRRAGVLLAAALLAGLASLIRQNGAFLAIAAGIALFAHPWGETDTVGARLRRACLAVAPSALALGGYHAWLFWIEGVPEAVRRKADEMTGVGVLTLGNLAFRAVEYLGLLSLPMAVASGRWVTRAAPRVAAGVTAFLAAAAAFLYVREGALMPYLSPVLYDLGVGSVTLRDTLFLGLPRPVSIGPALQWPITLVTTIAAGIVVSSWLAVARGQRRVEIDFTVLLLACLLCGSLLHTMYYYDRYVLPLQPAALVLLAVACDRPRDGRRLGIGAWLALLVMAVYSVAGTHDYLAWNRARFHALDELAAAGIEPKRIDGGVEFNAWHLAKAAGRSPSDAEAKVGHAPSEKSWWWVADDEYVVSMQPLEGYEVYSIVAYSSWLLPGRGNIYTLERVDAARPARPPSDQGGAASR